MAKEDQTLEKLLAVQSQAWRKGKTKRQYMQITCAVHLTSSWAAGMKLPDFKMSHAWKLKDLRLNYIAQDHEALMAAAEQSSPVFAARIRS